jgi:hypothetical protein
MREREGGGPLYVKSIALNVGDGVAAQVPRVAVVR